jgi:hypothetical protein
VQPVSPGILFESMGRNQKALRNTPVHEAGHAVEAFMLGIPFRSVTIKAAAESLGRIMFHKWPKWAVPDTVEYNDRRARGWFEQRTQIALAGQIAETLHAGRRPLQPLALHGGPPLLPCG